MAEMSFDSSFLSSERTSVMARTAAVCKADVRGSSPIVRARSGTYLLVDDRAESGLALDDGIRDAHLAAKSRQEDDQLNRIDVVGDDDKRSLLVLNEADNVVEAVLNNIRLLADVLLLLALLDGRRLPEQTLLLLRLRLRTVFVQELEHLGSSVLVKDVLELGDRRGHLQPHVENLLLALEADILRPLHHARQVPLGLDVLADAEVARPLFDQGVLTGKLSACETGGFICSTKGLTLGAFLAPAFPWGKGAGATFLPDFGGCH